MADGMIVDSFAGGGGASTGLWWALGRHPDIAINHNPAALAIHAANHPGTTHYCEDVYAVDPRVVTGERDVDVMWASPDCKHFSKAKGAKPRDNKVRGLAWVVVGWARKARPRVIVVENVEEFQDWGPLDDDNMPDESRRGLTFRRWVGYLRGAGYTVDWRVLRACDYGAPTTRKRLYVVARRDGRPIVWPEPTHGDPAAPRDLFSRPLKPWRTAAECIDWSIPCPSIFDRARPLADKTLARIARGIQRYVVESPRPYIVGGAGHTLIQTGYGEREGQAPRALDLGRPLGTVVAGGAKHALVAAFLARHYTGVVGQPLTAPMSTVTTRDHHSLVKALLIKYYGTGDGQRLTDPLGTVTTHDRFGLVTVDGVDHAIYDIGMRMLTPRELARAQGFPEDYVLDVAGLSKTDQVAMVGNSVCPPVAAAIVGANR